MRADFRMSLLLAAAVLAPAAARGEEMMSKDPSECEVYSALSGDDSCATEPAAGTVGVDGETQGLAISTEAAPDSGATTTTTTKKKKTATKKKSNTTTAATTSTTKATGDAPKAAAFQSIQFEFNSAELTAPARGTLDTVAAVLQEPVFAGSRFVIEGHTDAKGSDAYNQELSEQRAQAVVRYLVQQGVAAEKLSARGMGESKPYDADNPTAAVNRRVVVLNLGG